MARIGLTQLPRRLADHTGQTAPTYRRCFDYAVGNRFPAEFANSRWTVDDEPASLDVIAAALGMMPATKATSAKSSRKLAPTSVAA